MKLNANQSRFINQLLLKGPQRSDELAQAVGVQNSTIGHIGIELRQQGLVSSTNDGAAYQLWALTDHCRKCLNEAALAERVKAAKPFRVLVVSDSGIELLDSKYGTQESAQNRANSAIEKTTPDTVAYVVTLHSSVKYVAPVAAARDIVHY
jgi:hypothetical protein